MTEAEHDRRRPGRIAANPALIPLLRGHGRGDDDTSPDEGPAEQAMAPDTTNFGRCLFFTILLVVPLWGIVGAIGYWMIR